MSLQGLHLSTDGFFCGFAIFEKDSPRPRQYRLEAIQRIDGIFSENGTAPDKEALALHEHYGWTYLTRRGEFFIYYSDEADRELDTDPAVQALALRAVVRRERWGLVDTVFWAIVYPLLLTKMSVFLTWIESGTFFFLFSVFLAIAFITRSVIKLIYLHRLRVSLINGGLDQKETHSARNRSHIIRSIILSVCVALWLMLFCKQCTDGIMEKGYVPLSEYHTDPPFTTMADLIPGAEYTSEYYFVPNQLREYSDPIAPYNVSWQEHATLRAPDGRTLSGGMYIHYHETASPWIARLLARDYLRRGKTEKGFRLLELADMGIDSAAAYMTKYQAPCIILQNGNKVMWVFLYQTGDELLSLDKWALAAAQSLQ